MAIVNLNGIQVAEGPAPEVNGTTAADTLLVFGELEGGSVTGDRASDTITLDTLDGDAFGFTFNGNDGPDSIEIDNDAIFSAVSFVGDADLFGGKGEDTIRVRNVEIVEGLNIQGNDGDDSIFVRLDDNGFVNGPATDITGLSVNGNDGFDDIFIGGTELVNLRDSSFNGGKGDDSITINADDIRGISVNGDNGNDTIYVDANATNSGNIQDSAILGGEGDDSIFVGNNLSTVEDNLFQGNAGDDSIYITGGEDLFKRNEVFGGKGDDSIYINNQTDITESFVNGNIGEDFIEIDGDIDQSTVAGGKDDDFIELTSLVQNSIIAGDLGDDGIQFVGSAELEGSDVLGGDGDDLIFGGTYQPNAGELTDLTFETVGSADSDTLLDGGDGDDTIAIDGETAGDATILGGAGADTFQLWNGGSAEFTDFESGVDTLIIGDYVTTQDGSFRAGKQIEFFEALPDGQGTANIVTIAGGNVGTTLLAPNGVNLGVTQAPLFNGADINTRLDSILRAATNTATAVNTISEKILFLDTAGTDAGLYIYTAEATYVNSNLTPQNANILNTQEIALGVFAASDITVI